jgi:IS30 family transposase|tara:strand:+ start:291 stop:482 length:192 start_codon:yes stop_codon:yes gene_type:complete
LLPIGPNQKGGRRNKTDFFKITERQINEVESKLNNHPRKRHQYKMAIFVKEKLVFNSEVVFMS